MVGPNFRQNSIETRRHRTAWIEAGPEHGPLMIFLHGWPELGLVWRGQMQHFAEQGWRCIAPDMRGYGRSSRPSSIAAYAVREIVMDMVEMHDALGGSPAVWVGHDWGCAPAWAMASHHAERCRGVVNLTVPYFARGLALPTLIPLLDRDLYPKDRYPAGQFDYWLYYRENFARAAQVFEADVPAFLAFFYRRAPERKAGAPAPTASIRAQGGWFGPGGRTPAMPRDETLMDQGDFDALVDSFTATGFAGADAWYMNDAANLAYAAEAPNFGKITLPALFIHATNDDVCDTTKTRLADPMREDCADLTEVTIKGGHEIMLERPAAVNDAISDWLASRMECVQDVSPTKNEKRNRLGYRGNLTMCQQIENLWTTGTGNLLPRSISPAVLAFVTIIACATSASAQSAPNNNPSAAAMSAPPTTSFNAAIQAQNPLSPVYSLLNENSTNFNMGPLERTQDVLLVEPVIPIRLTPEFNLVTRWITPVIWQPALAPSIDSEFGLGNITPQFFFTPAHQGNGFVWGLGANAWLPTATDDTLGINEWGGGPTAVALWIQGPLLFGVLYNQTWAGDQGHGSSATFDRINQMAVQPFIFYNLSAGWYVASLPIITADWTVDDKWTVPIGGGIGRVMPLGNVNVNARLDAYYNGLLDPAEGITNVGDWSLKFTLHFVLPNAKVPTLF